VLVSRIAIVARVRVKDGRVDDYLAAFEPLLEQVEQEPGTLMYLVQRSKDDPQLFWTSELYADEAAFESHGSSEVHAAAAPLFNEVIADADVIVGEALMGKGPSA
jgi:(4S)-4-hydroxy-5-phosphonooxypentane-2,3-dione isomerase